MLANLGEHTQNPEKMRLTLDGLAQSVVTLNRLGLRPGVQLCQIEFCNDMHGNAPGFLQIKNAQPACLNRVGALLFRNGPVVEIAC